MCIYKCKLGVFMWSSNVQIPFFNFLVWRLYRNDEAAGLDIRPVTA